ncbi:uncharacterized protein [Rutidosis leptorrhynchoides]|uniref:uncharacterized protein n=1 Tax=Rutidosis leptorrhynchoides TaxID=125765 RepID=UPI003A9926C6
MEETMLARGQSDGIISMWDPAVFVKDQICHNGHFILFSDFNEVTEEADRFSSNFNPLGALHFNNFINNGGLIDRFLISHSVINLFPDAKLEAFNRGWSDHVPLYFHVDNKDFGPIPFKVYGSWLYRDGFKDFVEKSWEKKRVQELRDRIKDIEVKMKHSCASLEELDERTKSLMEVDEITRLEEMDLQQKAKINWDIEDIVAAVNQTFNSGFKNKGSLSAFISLIPKVAKPVSIKDIRPISLIGSFYKVISKLLTSRLTRVMDKIISPVQSAFISGRQILDGPLILSEIIEWYKRKNRKLMIFKVDFDKAYDSVNWQFLDYMMMRIGFGVKWRE